MFPLFFFLSTHSNWTFSHCGGFTFFKSVNWKINSSFIGYSGCAHIQQKDRGDFDFPYLYIQKIKIKDPPVVVKKKEKKKKEELSK
jgi:hypothetical protein